MGGRLTYLPCSPAHSPVHAAPGLPAPCGSPTRSRSSSGSPPPSGSPASTGRLNTVGPAHAASSPAAGHAAQRVRLSVVLLRTHSVPQVVSTQASLCLRCAACRRLRANPLSLLQMNPAVAALAGILNSAWTACQGGSAGDMRQRPLDAQALDARACFVLVAGSLHAHCTTCQLAWLLRACQKCVRNQQHSLRLMAITSAAARSCGQPVSQNLPSCLIRSACTPSTVCGTHACMSLRLGFYGFTGGVVHVWRGAEAHRAAREGVDGLCRAHDALAALLRALVLPPGTPVCLATQVRPPPPGPSNGASWRSLGAGRLHGVRGALHTPVLAAPPQLGIPVCPTAQVGLPAVRSCY